MLRVNGTLSHADAPERLEVQPLPGVSLGGRLRLVANDGVRAAVRTPEVGPV